MKVVSDIFRLNKIHHIPVVREGIIVGMISTSDYYRVSHALILFYDDEDEEYQTVKLESVRVKDVMTHHIASLRPDATLEYALGYLKENRFHALPVVNAEKVLVGILTTFDLLTYAFKTAI